MRIKIISTSFDNHEDLKINNHEELKKFNIDFSLYNDNNFTSRVNSIKPRTKSKIPKMLEWENDENLYDYYIWIDSKFTLNDGIIFELINQIGKNDLALFKHPYRDSISKEIEFIEDEINKNNNYLLSRYYGEDFRKQLNIYMTNKKFIDNKLFACGCFVYSKNLIINREYNLLKEWFYHNMIYSIQDQISLPYLLQKFNTNYIIYDFDLLNTNLLNYKN